MPKPTHTDLLPLLRASDEQLREHLRASQDGPDPSLLICLLLTGAAELLKDEDLAFDLGCLTQAEARAAALRLAALVAELRVPPAVSGKTL